MEHSVDRIHFSLLSGAGAHRVWFNRSFQSLSADLVSVPRLGSRLCGGMLLRPHLRSLCRASGPSVANSGFDFPSRYAHIGQITVIKPLELENGLAPASLGGETAHQPHTSEGEDAYPARKRVRHVAHEGADGKAALDADLPLKFKIRKLPNAMVKS